jgi:AraC-like DNA-binding protein
MPHPMLTPYISVYYLFEDSAAIIDDSQRADCGHLRLFMKGTGQQHLPNGQQFAATPAMLLGPHAKASRFTVHGPLRFMGCSLRPSAWGGLFPLSADSLLDSASDCAPYLKASVDDLVGQLGNCGSIDEMAPLIDSALIQQAKPIPREHDQTNRTIQAWLKSSLFPDVSALYGQCGLGERQVSRIANRYWGAAPKALARKYGALRTASHMLNNGGKAPAEAQHHYSDASHLIREIRRVTGMTPRQLNSISNMILRMTLDEKHFRELDPAV